MPTPTDIRIPLRDREPFLHVRRGCIDIEDGAAVLADANGVRMQIPIGALACLLIEPGTSITHAAVKACADEDCLLVWCGEGSTRFYSAGSPGGARSDKLLRQFDIARDPTTRLQVVREMFRRRFGDDVPDKRSVDQLRGLEGARVKLRYEEIAAKYGVPWAGRRYDPAEWRKSDDINRAISAANACLYAVTEAAVLVAGYSPAVGFLHSGKPLAFVYDIADLFKFDVSVPAAFEVIAKQSKDPEGDVRRLLRTRFRDQKMMETVIPSIEDILDVAD
ncbi:MAG: type I-E CRISPR-associated endonuclease Cas1e [Polyangiaceae bacterium]|jgi:CRISPR-associated protein Cas1